MAGRLGLHKGGGGGRLCPTGSAQRHQHAPDALLSSHSFLDCLPSCHHVIGLVGSPCFVLPTKPRLPTGTSPACRSHPSFLTRFLRTLRLVVMAGSALRSLVVAAAVAAVAAAATLPAVVRAADGVRTCATEADVGTFVGWCRCSSLIAPRELVAFNGDSDDPWCKVSAPDTTVYYCDAQGAGNCDLQCAAAIHECTSPPSPDNQVCACAPGKVRTVLRYNGPLQTA